MTPIQIARHLWFEETAMGGTLNFQVAGKPESILFKVGISHDSLKACNVALSSHFAAWKIRDGSLSLYGDREEVALHFSAVDGSDVRADLVLRGKELYAFRYAINALSQRLKYLFN